MSIYKLLKPLLLIFKKEVIYRGTVNDLSLGYLIAVNEEQLLELLVGDL